MNILLETDRLKISEMTMDTLDEFWWIFSQIINSEDNDQKKTSISQWLDRGNLYIISTYTLVTYLKYLSHCVYSKNYKV